MYGLTLKVKCCVKKHSYKGIYLSFMSQYTLSILTYEKLLLFTFYPRISPISCRYNSVFTTKACLTKRYLVWIISFIKLYFIVNLLKILFSL